MIKLVKPNEILQKYQDLDIKKYKESGYKAILVDIDNTLAKPDSQLIPDENALKFVKELKDNGFTVVVFSNNKESRVKPFADALGCEYNFSSYKPLPFSYFSVMKRFGLKKSEVLCLGDQLLTDCLGGNLAGITPIYVKQLVEKDSWKTVINRKLERLIFRYILHEKM